MLAGHQQAQTCTSALCSTPGRRAAKVAEGLCTPPTASTHEREGACLGRCPRPQRRRRRRRRRPRYRRRRPRRRRLRRHCRRCRRRRHGCCAAGKPRRPDQRRCRLACRSRRPGRSLDRRRSRWAPRSRRSRGGARRSHRLRRRPPRPRRRCRCWGCVAAAEWRHCRARPRACCRAGGLLWPPDEPTPCPSITLAPQHPRLGLHLTRCSNIASRCAGTPALCAAHARTAHASELALAEGARRRPGCACKAHCSRAALRTALPPQVWHAVATALHVPVSVG